MTYEERAARLRARAQNEQEFTETLYLGEGARGHQGAGGHHYTELRRECTREDVPVVIALLAPLAVEINGYLSCFVTGPKVVVCVAISRPLRAEERDGDVAQG